MPGQLSASAWATTRLVARTLYPHDAFPDEAYDKVVRKLAADAGKDDAIRATIEDGVADLDGFGDLDEAARTEALRQREGTPYFDLVRSTSVVELYDQPLVWGILGYEGASVHLGGYLHRGFDDLDWLPDPPIELDPTAGSHHS